MKKLIAIIMTILLVAGIQTVNAQAVITQPAKETKKIYNPDANAKEDISQAVKKAKADGKHVLIQVGGQGQGHGFPPQLDGGRSGSEEF